MGKSALDSAAVATNDAAALADQLASVTRRLRHASRRVVEPLGLTHGRMRVLRMLSGGPLRVGDLADRLGIAARSATQFVDELEGEGFVVRAPDPTDRRATLVELTARGTRAMASLHEAWEEEAARLIGRLTPAEQAELARMLRVLMAGEERG